jgi:hypothetical protein
MSDKVVSIHPVSEEDQIQRRIREAERLARQSPAERALWLRSSAERLGMPVDELRIIVEAEAP